MLWPREPRHAPHARPALERALIDGGGKMERANEFALSTRTSARKSALLENTENQHVSGYWSTLKLPDDDMA